jgi:hypothetical protein
MAGIMTIERMKGALFAAALALNPAVNQTNIHQTICVPGWTKSMRPPAQELRPIKDRLMAAIGATNAQLYQLDHMVPLELGGAPLDERNFQLQLYGGECNARDKDRLEFELSRLVCAGELTLDAAQREIADDWIASYSDHIDAGGCERD